MLNIRIILLTLALLGTFASAQPAIYEDVQRIVDGDTLVTLPALKRRGFSEHACVYYHYVKFRRQCPCQNYLRRRYIPLQFTAALA